MPDIPLALAVPAMSRAPKPDSAAAVVAGTWTGWVTSFTVTVSPVLWADSDAGMASGARPWP